jgi:signal transduction histidine kinase
MRTTDRTITPADDSQAERLHAFSHTLRNKITGLFEALQHIRTEEDAQQRMELATYAEVQFYHAMRETERLLDDLSVPRGVRLTVRQRLDLGRMAEQAVQHVQDRFQRKGQELEVRLAGGLEVTGDPYYLEEIVYALLNNASKFSHPGAATGIDLVRDGDQAVLRVRDHGVGLDPAELPDLFKRFAWLGSRSTAGEAQGRSTLARVKNWVEAHGGTIDATSEGPGTGCTFTVRLPLA